MIALGRPVPPKRDCAAERRSGAAPGIPVSMSVQFPSPARGGLQKITLTIAMKVGEVRSHLASLVIAQLVTLWMVGAGGVGQRYLCHGFHSSLRDDQAAARCSLLR